MARASRTLVRSSIRHNSSTTTASTTRQARRPTANVWKRVIKKLTRQIFQRGGRWNSGDFGVCLGADRPDWRQMSSIAPRALPSEETVGGRDLAPEKQQARREGAVFYANFDLLDRPIRLRCCIE